MTNSRAQSLPKAPTRMTTDSRVNAHCFVLIYACMAAFSLHSWVAKIGLLIRYTLTNLLHHYLSQSHHILCLR